MQGLTALFKRISAFFATIAALIASLFGMSPEKPAEPISPDVPTTVEAGELETHYSMDGAFDVSFLAYPAANETIEKYQIWYPTAMEQDGRTYPALLLLNGTSWGASGSLAALSA